MNLLSVPVLGGAALVSSPALWSGFVEGTSTPSVALTRYLVSVVLCWLALGAVAMVVGPPPEPEPVVGEGEELEQQAPSPLG